MVRILMKMVGYNIVFKIMWMLLSFIELYIICTYMPNKKIRVISNIGAYTLNIYLLHSLFVKWLKVYSISLFCYGEIINIVIMMIIACVILLMFGNEFVKDKMIYLTDLNKLKQNVLQKENYKI